MNREELRTAARRGGIRDSAYSLVGGLWLMPTTVALLRRRWEAQAQERAVAPVWETMTYEGSR